MSRVVRLLLLLSAMLSALSGAGIGARAPQVAVAVNSVAIVAASSRVARVAVAGRPLGPVPGLADVAGGVAFVAWQLAGSAPLYLNCRRE